MSSKRKNISISEKVEERAQAIIDARGFDGLSDCVATLIREEYERRHPPALQDAPGQPLPAQPPPQPFTYRKRKPSSGAARSEAEIAAQAIAALEKGLKLAKKPAKKTPSAGASPK